MLREENYTKIREKYSANDVGAGFAIVTLAAIAVSLAVAVVGQIFKLTENGVFMIAANAVNTLVIGASAFIYAKLTRTKAVCATKINVKPHWAHIGWGCLATLCLITFMVPLNNWIAMGIEAIGLPRPSVNLDMDVVSMIIIVAILPAFCEEVIFRGTLAAALEGGRNKLASLAIVGALFALFHMNPAQTVHQFALGAFLGLLFLRSGSLWTTVIVHFFNNIVVIALSAIFGEKVDLFFEQNAIWLFFVGLILFAGSIAGYLLTTKSKWNKGEETLKLSAGSLSMLLCSAGVCFIMWMITLFVGA